MVSLEFFLIRQCRPKSNARLQRCTVVYIPKKTNHSNIMSCSFATEKSSCGSTPYNPNEVDIIPLQSCRKDLTDYLTKLGVSESRGFGTKSLPFEYNIILNRAGRFFWSKEDRERMTVCPKHRYELTTHFQKLPSTCSYPTHAGETKKTKNPRRVNKQISEEIYKWFKVPVPIGSGKCDLQYIKSVTLSLTHSCHLLLVLFIIFELKMTTYQFLDLCKLAGTMYHPTERNLILDI